MLDLLQKKNFLFLLRIHRMDTLFLYDVQKIIHRKQLLYQIITTSSVSWNTEVCATLVFKKRWNNTTAHRVKLNVLLFYSVQFSFLLLFVYFFLHVTHLLNARAPTKPYSLYILTHLLINGQQILKGRLLKHLRLKRHPYNYALSTWTVIISLTRATLVP